MGRISFTLHSPTTPGNPGWSEDLTNVSIQQGFRSGDVTGLQTEAELGAVAINGLRLDDPTGTAGHASEGIPGLKQLSVSELDAPSGNRRIGEFYVADRRYSRGQTGSPSLRTAAARVVDISISDINAFLHFRILRTGTANGSNTTFNRPAETDVQRVTALLAVPFIATTLFDGLVSTGSPVNMDAVDYTGQTAGDVLNDCAQQSGKNYFVFYDESGTYAPNPGDYALFYDFNDSLVYPAAVPTTQVSNVLAEQSAGGNGPVWYPLQDAVLTIDPSRVISGAYFANGSNSVYRTNPTTSYAFGWRDGVGNSQNLRTVAMTEARADRYLSENSTEDYRVTFTLKMSAAHVNDWKEGQYAAVKFTHLPGLQTLTNVRCLSRTVAQDEQTDALYNVKYECTPMAAQPQGAFAQYVTGTAGSGIPTLPNPTTPGYVLLLGTICGSNSSQAAPLGIPTLTDDPDTTGTAGVWNTLATDTTDVLGQAILGPGHGFALSASWLWRYVRVGEVTTRPVQVSGPVTPGGAASWLWELPTTVPPTAGSGFHTAVGVPPHLPANYSLPSTSGNAAGIIGFEFSNTGDENAIVTEVSGTTVNSSQGNNDPTDAVVGTGWEAPWVWIGQLASGGVLTVNMDSTITGYRTGGLAACGATCILPPGVTLPNIPYPANQT